MYSKQKAAEILGVTERTVRTWMKQRGMKMVMVETDKRRAYVADDDMDILIDLVTEKVLRSREKTKVHNINSKKVITTGEGKYYSLAGAASILGVSEFTVKRWNKQDNIERKLFTTDTTRAYIAQADVFRLAELHERKLSTKVREEMDGQRDVNATQPDMDKLCSLKEVTLFLGVSKRTLTNWIIEDNIEKKMHSTDRERVYIAYRDVLGLAERHGREVDPNPPALTVKEEIKEMKSRMDKLASDIEDIKHDFRLFVKRSIYIPPIKGE